MVSIQPKENCIIVELPLTTPTGKVRVKRWIEESNFGIQIATRREKLTSNDYLEWQISYASKEGLDFIRFPNGTFGFELAEIIFHAKRLNLLRRKDLERLLDFVESLDSTIEESEKLIRRKCDGFLYGFRRLEEIIPIYVKFGKEHFVEIALKHKQKAVGYQAMVYLCVWIKSLEEKDLIGRPAKAKETATFRISSSNVEVITDTVMAFALASKQHNEDMKFLLEKVIEIC